MAAEAAVAFAGRELLLLAERALWWPSQRALLVADVHLGKGDVFRAHGIGVPAGSTRTDLQRLSTLLARFDCDALIVLGDLVHARPTARLVTQLRQWRELHPRLEMLLVRGNHDRRMAALPDSWRIGDVLQHRLDGVRLVHEPGRGGAGPELAGHLHPTCRLRAGRADSLRAPVFWLRPWQLLLPAFGSFTGGQNIRAAAGDRVFAVGPGTVMEVPTG